MAKWTLERWVTIIGIAVTVGMQWQIVKTQSDQIADLKKKEETLSERYVPREVYTVERQHLTEAIDRLTASLEKLYALERETGEPARVQRMFDK